MTGSEKRRHGGGEEPDWSKWQFVVTVIARIIVAPLLEHFWPGK